MCLRTCGVTFLAAIPGHAAAAAAAWTLMRSATASVLIFLVVPRAVNTKRRRAGVLAVPLPQCGGGGRVERRTFLPAFAVPEDAGSRLGQGDVSPGEAGDL